MKRLFSILLILALVLTMPLAVFASEVADEGDSVPATFILGDVDGNGVIEIADAIAILRYAVEMSSPIDDCEDAFAAALIVSTFEEGPQIADALQILRYVVGLLTFIDVPNLNDVRVVQRAVELRMGATYNLSTSVPVPRPPQARPPAPAPEVRYESRNTDIVTVDERGIATAVANEGSAWIFRYLNDVIDTVWTVQILPSTLALEADVPAFMSVGQTRAVEVALTPSTSTERVRIEIEEVEIAQEAQEAEERIQVARLTWRNELQAMAVGEFRVRVTSGAVSEVYTVIVENPQISKDEFMLTVGWFDFIRVGDTVQSVQWSSSNPEVASVSPSEYGDWFQITAHSAGYACIIATLGDGDVRMFADVRVITDLERQIAALQDRYPEGYFWNSNTPSEEFPNVSETPCDHTNDRPRKCNGQCAGFARLISNEVFGSSAPRYRVNDVSQVRQGDYIRYSNRPNHNHSIFIIRVEHIGEIIGFNRRTLENIYATAETWIVTDCNWWSDCGILWYRRFDPVRFVTTFNAGESYSRIQ